VPQAARAALVVETEEGGVNHGARITRPGRAAGATDVVHFLLDFATSVWEGRTQLVADLDRHPVRIHSKVPNTMFPQSDG
jgi:hypothetical protein